MTEFPPHAERPLALVVDDEAGIRLVARAALENAGFAVQEAVNGRDAVLAFERLRPALILLDVKMPEMDGFAACDAIRALPGGERIPILIMTALDDVASIRKAYQAGATDFATKPINVVLLGFRARYILRSAQAVEARCRTERENQALVEMLRLKNEELEKLNEALKEQSIRDGLTGLYNHRFFHEALDREIFRCSRYGHSFSLIFADVDSFKSYNDTHGHQKGDTVLRDIAQLMTHRVRKSDIVVRYGGEEFIVLLPEANREMARQIAEALRETIADYPFPGRETQPQGKVTASFGVSTFPEDGDDATTLIRRADQAMYQGKKNGRNRVQLAVG